MTKKATVRVSGSYVLLLGLGLAWPPGAGALPNDGLVVETPADVSAAPTECTSQAGQVKAVALQDYQPTYSTFNFPSDGQGHFDTLMATTIDVGGHRPSCLVANFSTMALPLDNAIVFQVRVDGQPMKGHLGSVAGVATAGVFDPEETDQNLPRMVTYTFFAPVSPGLHQVEVLFAGCCSAAPAPGEIAAYAGSPVLALHYR
jgi:hypothetical protein